MIADALQRGCRRIVMGIGGSATNDAGIGLLAALGYRFLDERGEELPPVGESLGKIARWTVLRLTNCYVKLLLR